MIRKLRLKMVFASMLSLLVVLAVIFSVAGVLNYRQIVTDANNVLDILVENDGRFPMSDMPGKSEPHEMDPPFDGKRHKGDRRFSAELPYESRYFSVFFAANDSVLSVNTGKIATVDTETAVEFARSATNSGDRRGFKGDFRYAVYEIGNERHIVFLDCGRELSAFRSFLFTCGAVSLAGLAAVFLLLLFLSAHVVKPFSENYEKQKRFITDAGHELKTPLTIIDADAEVLGMDIGENEWLNDIRSQTSRLAELTNHLIQLARSEERPQTEMIEFPLSDLAEETLDGFQALARSQGKDISINIQPMISMYGDQKSIRQLISILMDNALKYSDDGGKIEFTLEKQKERIRLSVFNTAEFVSKESLPHLFDRFYRADKSRNSQMGGYGLGLSIAQAITAAHKGKISASTRDEKSILIAASFPVQ